MTQAETAKLVGIRQPKVSELLRGHLDGFSTDRLLRFIIRLGYDVQIKLSKAPSPDAGAHGNNSRIRTIQARLEPGQGIRPGRPTDPSWVRRHPKVPMSDATRQRLIRLAEQSSTSGRKVSPMQIAAQILEDALTGIPDR